MVETRINSTFNQTDRRDVNAAGVSHDADDDDDDGPVSCTELSVVPKSSHQMLTGHGYAFRCPWFTKLFR